MHTEEDLIAFLSMYYKNYNESYELTAERLAKNPELALAKRWGVEIPEKADSKEFIRGFIDTVHHAVIADVKNEEIKNYCVKLCADMRNYLKLISFNYSKEYSSVWLAIADINNDKIFLDFMVNNFKDMWR